MDIETMKSDYEKKKIQTELKLKGITKYFCQYQAFTPHYVHPIRLLLLLLLFLLFFPACIRGWQQMSSLKSERS